MKNKCILLLLPFVIAFSTSCEPERTDDGPEQPQQPEEPAAEDIIEIPDEHFKYALISTNSIDTNGDREGDSDIDLNNDGEIQRTEAELVEGLILYFDNNEFKRYVDLAGIENFIHIKYFRMRGELLFEENEDNNQMITYDFTELKELQYLELTGLGTNAFRAVNLNGLDKLEEAILTFNRPDYAVPFEDWESSDSFMDVHMEGTTSLGSLDITNSFLNIDYCEVPSLKRLSVFYLEGGEPEVFDFHCLTQLEWLDISENYIQTLILKNSSVLNTLLAYDIGSSRGENYPFVEYICIDDIPEEYEQIATLMDENTVVTTDCTF